MLVSKPINGVVFSPSIPYHRQAVFRIRSSGSWVRMPRRDRTAVASYPLKSRASSRLISSLTYVVVEFLEYSEVASCSGGRGDDTEGPQPRVGSGGCPDKIALVVVVRNSQRVVIPMGHRHHQLEILYNWNRSSNKRQSYLRWPQQ